LITVLEYLWESEKQKEKLSKEIMIT
jgi:hypothetical protein